jgi:hypothetical protein
MLLPCVTSYSTATVNNTAPGAENSCMAIAAMVCGIVGIFVFGIVLGIIAIVLGCIARNKIDNEPHKFKGKCQANAGLVLGIVDVILWAILFVIILSG